MTKTATDLQTLKNEAARLMGVERRGFQIRNAKMVGDASRALEIIWRQIDELEKQVAR